MNARAIGPAGGGCTMCILPPDTGPDGLANAFAAGVAIAEEVKGDPSAIKLCPEHRAVVEAHRDVRKRTRPS